MQPTPSSRTRQYTHIFPRSRRFIAHARRRHHHSRPSVAHANGFHSQLRLVATSIFSRRIIPTRTFASVFTAPLPFPTIINVNPRAHTRQSPPHRARYHPRLDDRECTSVICLKFHQPNLNAIVCVLMRRTARAYRAYPHAYPRVRSHRTVRHRRRRPSFRLRRRRRRARHLARHRRSSTCDAAGARRAMVRSPNPNSVGRSVDVTMSRSRSVWCPSYVPGSVDHSNAVYAIYPTTSVHGVRTVYTTSQSSPRIAHRVTGRRPRVGWRI